VALQEEVDWGPTGLEGEWVVVANSNENQWPRSWKDEDEHVVTGVEIEEQAGVLLSAVQGMVKECWFECVEVEMQV